MNYGPAWKTNKKYEFPLKAHGPDHQSFQGPVKTIYDDFLSNVKFIFFILDFSIGYEEYASDYGLAGSQLGN